MSEETVKIPKFRKTNRIARWMEKNEHYERMPKEIEALFFSTKESPDEIIVSLLKYRDKIDGLPEELENLLFERAKEAVPPETEESRYFVNELLSHCLYLHRDCGKNVDHYIDLFKGKSNKLYRWATWTNKRLPAHLEDSIDDPSVLLDYAKEIVRGRLPSHLEDVFFKDVHIATQYAFDVIRGFAPVKLPDALHNFVIMESYKNTDDYQIKTYMKASESDPNKTGNSAEEL